MGLHALGDAFLDFGPGCPTTRLEPKASQYGCIAPVDTCILTVVRFVNWKSRAQIVWAGHQSDTRLWIFAQSFIDLCHVTYVVLRVAHAPISEQTQQVMATQSNHANPLPRHETPLRKVITK